MFEIFLIERERKKKGCREGEREREKGGRESRWQVVDGIVD